MKKLFLLLIILIILQKSSQAQHDTISIGNFTGKSDTILDKKVVYKASLSTLDHKKISGYINTLTDSTIFISKTPIRFSPFVTVGTEMERHHYAKMDKIIVKKKGSIVGGVIIGAVVGGLTGLLVGAVASSPYGLFGRIDPPPPNVTLEYTLKGTAVGAIFGGIIGAIAHKTFYIKGRKDKFLSMGKRLYKPIIVKY